MNITIDRIVEDFIAGNMPIPGALFCEYTLGNNFTPDLIARSYENPDRFHVDQRAINRGRSGTVFLGSTA